METKKVLIFPAGTEIAFEIVNALKYSKFVELYGGTSVDDHSEFVFKRLIHGFPYVDDEGFLDYLNSVIDTYEIDSVYPAHDSVSVFFSEHASEIHAQPIITDKETTNLCRSKKRTYDFFEGESFVPCIYNGTGEVIGYPVFVKPSVGQGSVGARIIETEMNLVKALEEEPSLVVCEYLPGMEYTVDCFTDRNGNLLVCKIRDRQRIRTGISVRSHECEPDARIQGIANCINSKLRFKGAWFFQVKCNSDGDYKLLEVSPRIPGTMGTSRNLGINFPMLTLFVFWGYDVSIIDNGYDILVDRALYSAYKIGIEYEHVYLDFDDTITYNNLANPEVMKFIYQVKNSGKKIHLLSKHRGDIYLDLARCCVSENLFDDITVIASDEEKADFITHENSIFIDDSFAERKKVHEIRGIPVFDVDMIESLIDWRS